ncbi:hydroxyethylthiazole kinase [Cerasibacillus terrae]|uniref:Hydroxyethylthiazole kinase n=1 Tax=Cerasibacillus terrae TaxID=2498845 RepID=A0A5C8NS13_9BACI|nr:hydroxyethylthiazole kinase [Cerasibacillus terrae]TXL63681.1 hydroxyethylthiazole kinase [Cerasibacillus terrae]
MNPEIIEQAREKNPLIHHIMNQVVKNFVANGVLAFGASPIMASEKEEAEEMAQASDCVLLNIGTLTKDEIEAMIIAGKTANKHHIPLVIDPVGVAATPFRSKTIKYVLEQVQPTVIKGNAGEIAHLVDVPWKVKGVDSIGSGNVEEIAAKAAKKYNTSIVITGKTDIICTGNRVIQNTTGHPFLTQVTGGGCLLGSIVGACLTTDNPIEEQLVTAVTFYGLAAEHAASQRDVKGPGTFLSHFVDALSYPFVTLKG